MAPRWVLMHALNLPLESAFVAEQRGGIEFRGWDEGRYMTARLIDSINILRYVFILAHKDPKKGGKLSLPEPYRTPDKIVLNKKKVHAPGSFAAIALGQLNQIRNKQEGG